MPPRAKFPARLSHSIDAENAQVAMGFLDTRWQRTKSKSRAEYERALQPRFWPSGKTAEEL